MSRNNAENAYVFNSKLFVHEAVDIDDEVLSEIKTKIEQIESLLTKLPPPEGGGLYID